MNDCICDSPYKPYSWPGWGCYLEQSSFTCPNHSKEKYDNPLGMNDCACDEGFAWTSSGCVYAYVFHVHGRVWIENDTTDATNFNETDFQLAMSSAIEGDDSKYYQVPCPSNFGQKLDQTTCESAKDADGVSLGCEWSDVDEQHDHLHSKTENNSAVTFTIDSERNLKAQCVIKTEKTSLARAEKVQPKDILPYSIKNVTQIQESICTATLDHSKFVLVESDSDPRKARHTESDDMCKQAFSSSKTGVSIGFAVKLRGTSMQYGNQLINAMKTSSLAATFKTEYSAAGDVHIFVWALTAEFWRQTPKTTPPPYTWAPKAAKKPVAAPTPGPEVKVQLEQLGPEAKATVNMALTIACDCPEGYDTAGSHINCLTDPDHGYLSMYDFPPHMQRFERAIAKMLLGNEDLYENQVVISDISPAGLHPHDKDTWSPVHADPNANGIEVHFKVAADRWGNASDPNDHGLLNIKNTFDSTDTSFTDALAAELQTNSSAPTADVWNVPKECIRHNKDPISGLDVKAFYTMKHWHNVTHAPTPAPTPAPLGTPGRVPNCVDGQVVVIKGHAEILSPAPLTETTDKKAKYEVESHFLDRVRTCMADNLQPYKNNASDADPLNDNRRQVEQCDILVSHGAECTENGALPEGCQECNHNWNTDEWRCNGLYKYEGQIYKRPGSNSTIDDNNSEAAGRRLLHTDDPNRPLQVRHLNDGNLTIYRFNYEINVPSADMHHANAIFSQIKYKQTTDNKNEFTDLVNFCMKAGHTVAPKYAVGNLYRPSVPTFSEIAVDNLQYEYVHGQAKTTTAAPSAENTQDCQIVWSQPTACTKTCGDGGKQFIFGLLTQAQVPHDSVNGDLCQRPVYQANGNPEMEGGEQKMENFRLMSHADLRYEITSSCNSDVMCPKTCTTNPWTHWGNCSAACGGGKAFRSRTLAGNSSAYFNGTDGTCLTDGECNGNCGEMQQSRTCNNFPCPQDCKVTLWGEWGTCTKQCQETGGEPGQQWRRRTIVSPAYYGGKDCGALTGNQTCNENPCPVNCVVSQWSEWGTCDQTCAGRAAGTRLTGAKQERTRYIVKAAENGGHSCPSLVQKKLCALHPCGAHVCTTSTGFPLTCTYENNIVYTHHVNDVHDNELFMCYHNYVTQVCTCLCWNKDTIHGGVHRSNTGNVDDLTSDDKKDIYGPSV